MIWASSGAASSPREPSATLLKMLPSPLRRLLAPGLVTLEGPSPQRDQESDCARPARRAAHRIRRMTSRPAITTLLVFAGAACTPRLTLPEMPPIIAEVDGVRIHADSHHSDISFLTAEENAERHREDLANAEVDAGRVLRHIRWECPSLPTTLKDFCRTSLEDRDGRAGLYVHSLDPSVAGKLWVSSFANVQLVAHEFGHLMEWRMLPESFHLSLIHI